jgi:hypothetical protein
MTFQWAVSAAQRHTRPAAEEMNQTDATVSSPLNHELKRFFTIHAAMRRGQGGLGRGRTAACGAVAALAATRTHPLQCM